MTEVLIKESDVLPRQEQQDVGREKSPRQEARRKYFEALRPNEAAAERIRFVVNSALQRALERDPTAEHKRILEIGAGIFLWEQRVRDTGNSLPVGLKFSVGKDEVLPHYGDNHRDMINFDNDVFTFENYAYVTKILSVTKVLDEVEELQQTHLREHNGEIVSAMENLLRNSPFMDYLDSFKGKEQSEAAAEGVPLEPGSIRWQREKGNLERAFLSRWGRLPGRSGRPDPILHAAYIRDVEQRLRKMRVSEDTDGKQQADKAREHLRSRVRTKLHAKSQRLKKYTEDQFEQSLSAYKGELGVLVPDDGKAVISSNVYTDDLSQYYAFDNVGEDLQSLLWDELLPLNDNLHFWNIRIPVYALRRLIPYLYDMRDTRDFQTIIDEELPKIAELIAIKVGRPFGAHNDFGARDAAWLTDVFGPIAPEQETEDWYEHQGGIENYGWVQLKNFGLYGSKRKITRWVREEESEDDEQLELRRRRISERVKGYVDRKSDPLDPKKLAEEGALHIPTAKETELDHKVHLGIVKFATQETFTNVQQRLVTRTERDDWVYEIPTDDAMLAHSERRRLISEVDAVIEVKDKRLGSKKEDPEIEGMVLVARDKEKGWYYYQIDPESRIHDRIEKKLQTSQQEKLYKLCHSIGMYELARSIRDADSPSIEDFIDLARPYMIGYIPQEGGKQFTVDKLEDFLTNGSIDTDGNLRGVCDSFERFIHLALAEIEGEDSVERVVGLSFHNGEYITIDLHAKTKYTDKETGRVYIIDMEPDPSNAEISTKGYERRVVKTPANPKHMTRNSGKDLDTLMLRPEEQLLTVPEPAPVDSTLEGLVKRERRKKEAAAAVDLFERMLLTYVVEEDIPVHISSQEALAAFDEKVHDKIKTDLHKKWRHWGKIPHILLYSLIHSYEQWHVDPREDKGEYYMTESDQEHALRILKEYQKAAQGGGKIVIEGVQVPQYDPQFSQAMERVVVTLGDLSENNEFFALGFFD